MEAERQTNMGLRKRDLLFFVFGFATFGCAGAVFPYRNYGLDGLDYSKGRLLGPEPKDDLDFSKCTPSEANAHPCTIMFWEDFQKMKLDYKDMANRLRKCERTGE